MTPTAQLVLLALLQTYGDLRGLAIATPDLVRWQKNRLEYLFGLDEESA